MDESAASGPRARDRMPRNRQRERILRLVRDSADAIDAAGLSSLTGLHVTTVRFHLEALCADGMVTRTRLKQPGAGRPRTGFIAARERLDYRVLSEILATALGGTEEIRARRAEHAGRAWAARIPESRDDRDVSTTENVLDRTASHAHEVFEQMGFAPEVVPARKPDDGERSIKLHQCPVRELARSHPEVGCRLHLGVLEGLVDKQADERSPRLSVELEPFVEPELCVAKVVVP